jgi:hypothetical protein
VKNIIKNLKNNKSPGPDKINNEFIKINTDKMTEILTELFNAILTIEKIPTQWKNAEIILLFKKGAKNLIKNYRPISLSSNIAKIFMKLIKNRIYKQLDFNQSREQAGFRSKHSTIDHIFTLNQLMEKAREYKFELNLLFIDFNKAFDSIEQNYLWEALAIQGIENKIINILKELYKDAEACIKMDRMGPQIKIERGIRQGDPLSPNLFNSALEEIFKQFDWEGKGVKINGEWLNHLRFADDVVLISESIEELQKMAEEFLMNSKEAGLTMNLGKTKLMSNRKKDVKMNIENVEIEQVDEMVYLGQIISFEERIQKEVKRRINLGWRSYWALKNIYKGKLDLRTKIKVLEKCTMPVITYGAQTWALTEKLTEKLRTAQRSMERSIMGIKKKDRVKNTRIREETGTIDIGYAVKKLKWKYAGHMARSDKQRWNKITSEWRPYDRKRGRGRPLTRWRDEIIRTTGVMWERTTAQERASKQTGKGR